MHGFENLHLAAPVAEALARLGWSPEAQPVREAVPTAARGHNVAIAAPPAAAYAGPALAGVVSRLAGLTGGARGLLVCPAAELGEWGGLVQVLAHGTGLRVQVAHGPARATRRLRAEELDLLVASPATAWTLLHRGALKADALATVVLAGPDRWPEIESLAGLMQDLPKESQRVIVAGDPVVAADLIERYARKAMTVGMPPAGTTPPPAVGPVRTVAVAWHRRADAVGALVELLDPASLVVWTADRMHHPEIAPELPTGDPAMQIVTGDAPRAEVVVAFDPPTPERLRQLLEAGEVVLLVPPGAEGYVERIAQPHRPLRLPGLIEAVSDAGAARRAAVVRAIEAGPVDRALLTLGPLLERYDPVAVAAALYELWTAAGAPGAAAPIPDIPATTRVYVGVGRNDGATPGDLVAVLTKELRVRPEKIGRIELRDGYSLVELPAREAEHIATALNGAIIRRKRVVARVDRGRARPLARVPRRGS